MPRRNRRRIRRAQANKRNLLTALAPYRISTATALSLAASRTAARNR